MSKTQIVNGKRLTPKQTELYNKLMAESPDFREKVSFLASGGTFRYGKPPRVSRA